MILTHHRCLPSRKRVAVMCTNLQKEKKRNINTEVKIVQVIMIHVDIKIRVSKKDVDLKFLVVTL